MEEAPDLPADILRFIRERIDSVAHLGTLLFLSESARRHWKETEAASRLYAPG
jgi:hypothetical protein